MVSDAMVPDAMVPDAMVPDAMVSDAMVPDTLISDPYVSCTMPTDAMDVPPSMRLVLTCPSCQDVSPWHTYVMGSRSAGRRQLREGRMRSPGCCRCPRAGGVSWLLCVQCTSSWQRPSGPRRTTEPRGKRKRTGLHRCHAGQAG